MYYDIDKISEIEKKMLRIKEEEIQRIVSSPRNYELSFNYYNKQKVEAMEIHKVEDKNEVFYDVSAIVDHNYFGEVKLRVNQQGKVLEYQCHCYYCDEQSACAHVGAVLYEIKHYSPYSFPFVLGSTIEEWYQQQNKKDQIYRNKALQQEELRKKEWVEEIHSSTHQWILEHKKSIHRNVLEQSYHQQIHIIVEIKKRRDYFYRENFEIRFKVGSEKYYYIKNISAFLTNLNEKTFEKYGKNFAFVHDVENFDEESQRVIDLMKYCLLNRRIDSFYDQNKSFVLDSKNIDEVYDCISQLPKNRVNVDFYEERKKLQVVFIQGKYGYEFSCLDSLTNYQEGYRYLYEMNEESFIRYDLGKAYSLYRQFQLDERIMIAKEDYESFKKYILDEMSDDLILDNQVDESPIKQVQLVKLCLYGDIDDVDGIYFHVEGLMDDGSKIFAFDQGRVSTPLDMEIVEEYIRYFAQLVNYEKHLAYFDDDSDTTYFFMNEGLPYLAQYCEIFVSDALHHYGRSTSVHLSLGVKVNHDLLQVNLQSFDLKPDEVVEILKAYRRKKKYHRLNNGKLIYLNEDEMAELDHLSSDLNLSNKDLATGFLDVPLYRSYALDELSKSSQFIQVNRSVEFEQLMKNLQFSNHEQMFSYPSELENVLRDYQKSGYQWLKRIAQYGFGGILADDMGLGKTLQIIALLLSEKGNGCSIVITPASLLLNWADELSKFAADLNYLCVYGNSSKRAELVKQSHGVDVLITSYDYIRRDIELYDEIVFNYIVLDEAQFIKNQQTKNAQSVKRLKGKHRFALTGTPIENSLAELWSIFDFLMPNYLYNYHYFQNHFEKQIIKESDDKKLRRLQQLVRPFILRRTKKEVLKELPDKIEKTIHIEFDEESRKLYMASLVQVNKDLHRHLNDDRIDKVAVLAMLTRLRQICCEPRLLYENIHEPSPKLNACMELIERLVDHQQKILLFSSFTSVLDLIAEQLQWRGLGYHMLTGRSDKQKRKELVQQFQNDDVPVFLISLKAGGTGLNLTAATAVIHFDPWWNLSAENQASDRAHRIGQNEVVQVFKLIMKDSIEEKIQKLQEKKKEVADTFIQSDQGMIHKMNMEEILNLFKME